MPNPTVTWLNYSKQTLIWVAGKKDRTSQQGELEPNKQKEMDRSDVTWAGWMPSNFTGVMIVSIPQNPGENVVVRAAPPSPAGGEFLDELKAGE
jgi:hypothetical protein